MQNAECKMQNAKQLTSTENVTVGTRLAVSAKSAVKKAHRRGDHWSSVNKPMRTKSMEFIFKNTLNTRAILKDSFKFIRSDVPTLVTEEERLWLIENNITTIVDLRTNKERLRKVCPLESDERFDYCIMPVTGGDIVPKMVNDVSESYMNMVDEYLYKTIDFIYNNKSNVLYFCNAGKDRTGVVSAILLYKSGKTRDYIVADYMKSKENLKNALNTFAKQNPEIDINVITPDERYIKEFLDWFAKKDI